MTLPAHDAFLSYSQSADGRLAPALETGLERLAKPLFRLRAIDVFRDKTGLSASPGLWSGIVEHLERSRWLVFLASPQAALSPWCTKELLWWLDRHCTQRLLIVLTAGTLVWDATGNDLDWAHTNALPQAARGRFAEEPLYVDLRWAQSETLVGHRDPRLRPLLLDLAAPIRGIPKDTLDGDDVRQQRRTRQIAAVAVAGIVTAAGLAVWQAVEATRQRDEANRLRDSALSRQLAAQSAALLVRNPVLALQLAAESRAVSPTVESSSALLGAVTSLPLTRMHQHGSAWWALAVRPGQDELVVSDIRGAVLRGSLDGAALNEIVPPAQGLALFRGVDALAIARDGSTWAHAGSSGEITVRKRTDVRRFDSGDKVGEMNPSLRVLALAFSPDGRWLASASTSGRLTLHDLGGGAARPLFAASTDLAAVAFSPDGRWLVAGGDRGLLKALPVEKGAKVPPLAGTGRGTVHTLAFDAAGRRLFAASRDGRIEAFDAQTGRSVAVVEALEHGGLERLAVSPDGRFMVTGHTTGAVVLWHRPSDDVAWPHRVLLRHAAAVRGLAFAADGRRVVSAGADGRLFVTLPVDRGRWTALPGPTPAVTAAAASDASRSPDGRWIAAFDGVASPDAAFRVDLGALSLTETPKLTIVRAADRVPLVERADLPAESGEKVSGTPVFAADSSTIAMQVSARVLLWDMTTMQALDASIPLPPGASLFGALPAGAGWLARSGDPAFERYRFDTDPDAWRTTACTLAGRSMTAEEWKRYLGDGRGFSHACR